jgi:indolepyruvate ferredoxin oxidoreductase
MEQQIADAVGAGRMDALAGTRIATALLGDSIATNLFMLGYAWQKGLIPLAEASLIGAIEKNGAAVKMNISAFRWGRRAAVDLAAVEHAARPRVAPSSARVLSDSLDTLIARRVQDLTKYQNAAYAERYSARIRRVRDAEAAATPGQTAFAEAVARYLYKLMAIKDEYEVARLYTQTGFPDRMAGMFEGDWKPVFNLAPPIFAKRDPVTGVARKREYGAWMLHVFRVLARMKFLRGTALDVFGRTQERRHDRAILSDYDSLMDELCQSLTPDNHALAVELAALPEAIRGYGHIRARHIVHAEQRRAELIAQLHGGGAAPRPQDASIKRARSRVVMAG